MKVTAINYGQFLINSHVNFTGTYMADTADGITHDSVTRYLKREHLRPRLVWEKARQTIKYSAHGHLIFDDTVADKNHSRKIEATRSQYSGNAKKIVTGIGVVNCVYYNPDINQFWVIDFRIFDPSNDGKSKLDHVEDMIKSAIRREVQFTTVLMDAWYATTRLMLMIHELGKIFYCPLKSNRLVDDSGGREPYRPVQSLVWSADNVVFGKRIKINKFPKNFKVQLFRVTASNGRTDYVVTNHHQTHNSVIDAQEEMRRRWKIEQLHREEKQLTGLERCQARLNRSQRNHICLATLAWHVLREAAQAAGKTIYEQKRDPLRLFVADQWRNPATTFVL